MAGCGWFWAWALVGVLLVIGLDVPPVLLVAGLAGWLVGRFPAGRASIAGIATGAGLPLLVVAYWNRHGPGTVCHAIGTARYPGTECGEQMNPWPWLVIGLVLVGTGVVGYARTRRV